MKTALAETCIRLYEAGLTPEQIGVDQDLDSIAVKSLLLQFCPLYRDAVGSGENLVTKDEVAGYMAAYKQLVYIEDDVYIKEKVLRHLINMGLKVHEGLGASDTKKLLREVGGTANILNLQMIIQQARRAKDECMDDVNKILDLDRASEASPVQLSEYVTK